MKSKNQLLLNSTVRSFSYFPSKEFFLKRTFLVWENGTNMLYLLKIQFKSAFYTLRPLEIIKKAYTNFMQTYVTGKKRRGGLHKVYIFLFSITRQVDCPSECPSVLYEHTDLSIIKSRHTRVGRKISVNHTPFKFISNIGGHAHPPQMLCFKSIFIRNITF